MFNHAKYTVVLKNLLDVPETKALIDKALSTYPLYEKKSKEEWIPSMVPSRSELNQKLLNAYKYREIGFETVGRFIDELEIAMNEIMPRYNQLLFSVDQDYNILYNADYTRKIEREKKNSDSKDFTGNDNEEINGTVTSEGTTNNTTTGSSKTDSTDSTTNEANITSNSKNIHSDTPQTQLDVGTKEIDNVEYASDASWNENISNESGSTNGESNVNVTSNGTNNTTNESTNTTNATNTKTSTSNIQGTGNEEEDTLEVVKGNYGMVSSQYLVDKYRETIINVEQMIINDPRIRELFMLVF